MLFPPANRKISLRNGFHNQGTKSDNMIRLYELDDNPDRRLFLDKLLHYMEERGTPLTQCPTISKQPLDLYRLYHHTKERGGYLEVQFKFLFNPNNPLNLYQIVFIISSELIIYFFISVHKK